MQKEIDNLEFVQRLNFELTDSLRNSGTKYLLNFDTSSEQICNSKTFVDIATAGRHCELGTIYIKHNLFLRSNFGREVELHNTHIVLFQSLCDAMKNNTRSAQLGLASELLDWYGEATSVRYSHLLIELSPRTDDRLQHSTNTGSIRSKSYIHERLKHLKSLAHEHTKTL